MEDNKVYLPFRWALDNIPGVRRKNRDECTQMAENAKFLLKLRNIQQEVKSDCITALNKSGCHLISLYAGSGKTLLSVYLACKIGLKTLVICHRIGLIEQWIEEIGKSTENIVCSIIRPLPPKNTKKAHNLNADFLFVNAQNMGKIGREAFNDVGLVIIDEIHSIMAEKLSECLYYVSPRFLVGLSATMYRPDGLDGLLDFYFGVENKTYRKLYHPHIVYKISTDIEFEEDSRTQWNALITSQATNETRNNFILNIITSFKERYFMVLCQRVEQASYIHSKLITLGEKSSLYVKNITTYDRNSRIIVASISKGGVGFSYEKLDSLIIASDCISDETEEYMIQYLARVFRREDVNPIVFDIVDSHNTLKKHFAVRKRVYQKSGGIIKDFYKDYPEFNKI